MPPTPSSASKEEDKKKSGTKQEKSMTNDRERGKAEEVATAFMAASLEPSTGVTDESLAATGGGEDTTSPDTPPCDGCKQPFAGIMQCGRCGSVFYCGRDCQLSHWTAGGHKKECKQLKKKNEETAKRVLENFDNFLCWGDLAATGAYNAAVRLGLHDKIREAMEVDKTGIVGRYQNIRGVFMCYTPSVISVLFRGERAEGRTTTSPTVAFVDGPRVKGYVRSHADALDAWLQASVQLLRNVTDRAPLPVPLFDRLVYAAADDVWLGWEVVFTSATAARAVLSPFPSPTMGAASGGESAEQMLKRGEDHARRVVKVFGEALRLVRSDPGTLHGRVCVACALALVRTQEYGIGIDVEGILNLNEFEKEVFQFFAIPRAKRSIEKGAKLTKEEDKAIGDEALRRMIASVRAGARMF